MLNHHVYIYYFSLKQQIHELKICILNDNKRIEELMQECANVTVCYTQLQQQWQEK